MHTLTILSTNSIVMGRASSTVQRMKSQDVEPLQLHTGISGFSCCGIEPFGNSEESRYFRTVSALTYLSNHPSGTYLKPFHLYHTNPQLKDLHFFHRVDITKFINHPITRGPNSNVVDAQDCKLCHQCCHYWVQMIMDHRLPLIFQCLFMVMRLLKSIT
jgi:hypothetical protein